MANPRAANSRVIVPLALSGSCWKLNGKMVPSGVGVYAALEWSCDNREVDRGWLSSEVLACLALTCCVVIVWPLMIVIGYLFVSVVPVRMILGICSCLCEVTVFSESLVLAD